MWNSVPNKSGIGWAIFWCTLKCFSPPVGLTVKLKPHFVINSWHTRGMDCCELPDLYFCFERYVQPSILHQLTSSTCMVCRMLSKLVTILNYQKKSQLAAAKGHQIRHDLCRISRSPPMRCSDISDMITPAGAMFVHPIHGQLVGPPSEFWSFDPNFVPLGY